MYLQEILCEDADNLLTLVCQVGAVGLPVRMALSVDVRQGAPGSCPECPGCDWQKGCWSALTCDGTVAVCRYRIMDDISLPGFIELCHSVSIPSRELTSTNLLATFICGPLF